MPTHTYDFTPGDTAYAVIDNDCIREVLVLQYTFETYLTELDTLVEEGEYVVKFTKEESTAFVLPTNLYATPADALAAVEAYLLA